MRKAEVATRGSALTPHPNPSPQGEGLGSTPREQIAKEHDQALLPRDKGTLEAKQKGGDEGRPSLMKARARSLRRKCTDAEVLVWQHLRSRRLLGCKFRRQVPIGKYIVDFLCEDPPIIIELDGGQHMEQQGYDQTRTNWLQANSFLVLRFWNNDIAENMEGVLENLFSTIEKSRPATSS